MGDMSGGLSGLFGGSSPPADPTGGLGMGGFDPTGGGGFADPMMSGDPTGGMGGDPSALGIASPTAQMQQAMGGTQALTQPPITDQPSATPAPGQAPSAPPQPPQQLDKAQALFGGPSTHPDWGFGDQPAQGPSSTPGDPNATFNERFGGTDPNATFNERFGGTDPNATFNERFGGTDPNATFNERYPSGAITGIVPPTDTASQGSMLGPGAVPPTATASQGPMLATGAIPDNLKTTPALTPDVTGQPGTAGGGGTTSGATSQVTPPGTPAPAGQAPQSPLEQLVSGFMHMLFGGGQGGLGPLEQLIARFLGLNPRQLFPQFYGGGFNRPTGPGYYPAGTTGGRNIQGGPPRLQGAPNPNAPRAPVAPGQAPAATVPRRNEFDPTLPGPPYTAQSRDQPPPWYRPGQNPTASQASGQSSRADNDYISQFGGHSTLNSVNQKGVEGLNPEFGRRLAAAGRAYQQETGQRPAYGEGYRDDLTQQKYWHMRGDRYDPNNPAARPRAYGGRGSLHESGAAMDLPSGGFMRWMAHNASRFGLGFPVPNDSNHVQMVNLEGQQYPYASAAGTSQSAAPAAPATSSRAPSTPQQQQVQQTVNTALQQAGASSNAISGIMANIQDEPNKPWDPSDREFDRQGSGEAGYAHGLYQEGGDNWNRYQHWLQGRDWRDPALQTQFLTENLKHNYPRTWARMNAAQTPGQAAQIFLNEYLRPAMKYRIARSERYGRGVPVFRGF